MNSDPFEPAQEPDVGAGSRLDPLGEDWDRALAVVAHPDDLEYGASSAVARWRAQGKSIVYLLVTRGEAGIDSLEPALAAPLREAEQRAAAAAVGVNQVEFLDHRDGEIEYGVALRRDIAGAIRRHQPEVVISINYRLSASRGRINLADHRSVGRALLDAVRDAGNRWVFTELTDAGLRPWNGVRRAVFAASPQPTHAVDVSDHVEAGVTSLTCHSTYLAALGGVLQPADYLRDELARTGLRAGVASAVAFEVISF